MKVRISFTVDVDAAAWSVEYGTGTTAEDVRADVRQHAEDSVVSHFDSMGVLNI